MPRNLVLASIVLFSIGAGLLIGTSGRPYWDLGFFPEIVIADRGLIFPSSRTYGENGQTGSREMDPGCSKMLQEAKEPRWKDETIIIPQKATYRFIRVPGAHV